MSEFRRIGRELIEDGEAIEVGGVVLRPVTEVEVYEVDNETFDRLNGNATEEDTKSDGRD